MSDDQVKQKMEESIREHLLLKLVEGSKLETAPIKTERYGKHFEFLVGIGNDETATITMTLEAYEALVVRTK